MSTAIRPLTLSEISAALPGARGAKRLAPSTLTRWIITGCPARDGQRIRLPATRCGSRWLVYQTDLDTFFAALAADPMPTPPVQTPRSETARSKASQAAGKRLAAMGA